jgi:SAM-dependent methyltransferase
VSWDAENSLDASNRHNQAAWDRMAAREHPLTQPATAEELQNPLAVVDPAGWLPKSILGWKVLCLAAGGGRQSALYAAAGAEVTVVDLSSGMLELDRLAASKHGFAARLIQTTMEDLSMLGEAYFDLVIQPVSTCYVRDIILVYRQVARVLAPRGLYISQHKTPANLQATLDAPGGFYRLEHPYYDRSPVSPAAAPNRLREPGTMEFVHRWEEILGGLCRCGFTIEDVVEPFHARPDEMPGQFGHRCHFIAPYIRLKARRLGDGERQLSATQRSTLLLP